jgi:DNA modification methylase
MALKSRIVGEGTEAPDQLLANPENFRRHPKPQQEALEAALSELGWIQRVIVNERTGHIIDGHLRVELALRRDEPEVPVLYVDLTENEERIALATLDPISGLAYHDEQQLEELLAAITTDNDELAAFLDSLGKGKKGEGDELDALQVRTSLAEQFLIPPFSVLDARQGYWQDRKRLWLALGIRSELGRGQSGDKQKDNGLTFALSSQPPRVYDRKAELEVRDGQVYSWLEFAEKYPEEIALAGDSIFDPVLTEIAYRWFAPQGGRILDPFAGGSVRGVVAGMLGYTYTGIELRPEQVKANRQNWTEITAQPAAATRTDHAPEIVVEEVDGIKVVRDDLCPGGTKRRVLERYIAANEAEEYVYASPAFGFAQIALAIAGAQAGKRVTIFTASRKTPHKRTKAAQAAGAIIEFVKPGYLSNVQAKAREYCERSGAHLVPFGIDSPEFIDGLAEIAKEAVTGAFKRAPKEVWTVAGSGVLTRALQKAWPKAEFHAVQIGAEPEIGGAKLYKAPEKFEGPAKQPPPFPSCPEYDAKAWRFIQKHASKGAVFWNVAADLPIGEAIQADGQPEWLEGDSTELARHLRKGEQFDLIFSCPPYADLEKYSDDPRDLSNMPYSQFRKGYQAAIAQAVERLKENRFAVFVVGEVRDKKGVYRNFVNDTVQAFEAAGLKYYNEAILVTPVGSSSIRAARMFRSARKLCKTHQNLLVFTKGSQIKQPFKELGGFLADKLAEDRQLLEAHEKVLVFAKGDPDSAPEELGDVLTADPEWTEEVANAAQE